MNPTTRRLLIIGLLILLFLLGFDAGRSSAVEPPIGGWGVAYYKAAQEYWGGTPANCASTEISWDSPVPERRIAELVPVPVQGIATVAKEPGTACHMWIAPMQEYGVYTRCILFGHEYGHWMGHPDSRRTKKRSLKYEVLGYYTYDPPCSRLAEEVHATNPLIPNYTPENN